MMAGLFAGRLKLLVIEEGRELFFLSVETSLLVELVLQLQVFDAEAVEPATRADRELEMHCYRAR